MAITCREPTELPRSRLTATTLRGVCRAVPSYLALGSDQPEVFLGAVQRSSASLSSKTVSGRDPLL